MIRINLLSERKTAREPIDAGRGVVTDAGAGGTLQNLLLAAILLAALGGFLGFGYYVRSTLSALRTQVQEANAELARLSEIRKKMDQYTTQKQLLERKVNLITDLKRNQEVPVHLLDQISKSLPDFLWLDTLRQDAGNNLTINGKATNYNSVADFYNRLIGSGWFVNVTQGKVYEVAEGVAFTLTCEFSTKNLAPQPAEGGQS